MDIAEEGRSSRSSSSSSEESCGCEHDHSHAHAHSHSDGHGHEHGHSHENSHAHSHEHEHGHGHSHEHVSSHEHAHGHAHEHEHSSSGHDHSHAHAHTHSGHEDHGDCCCEDDSSSSSSSQCSGCCEEEEDSCCDCGADHAPGYALLDEEDECESCKVHTHTDTHTATHAQHDHTHAHTLDHTHTHAEESARSHSHVEPLSESRSLSLSEAVPQPRTHSHSHSHSHSHKNSHAHKHSHSRTHSHSHSRSHSHAHSTRSPLTELLIDPNIDLEAGEDEALLLSSSSTSGVNSGKSSNKCNSCDPTSTILHVIQVTRFRVANLCCAGEEKLIREALGDMIGIENVAINIVGRYAVVKHCTVDCCAPSQKILDTLNALHLGVSIHEVADDEGEQKESIDWYELMHVVVVALLFLVGLALYLREPTHSLSKWVFVPSIAIGLVPIIKQAFISLIWRRNIDINSLIVIAVAGALAVDEFFDASLVVAMFLAAEFIESAVMVFVRNAISLSTSNTIPKKAFTVDGRSLNIEDLKIGDVVACRAGEMIVCDGKVVRGEGVVDESSLTGEAVPIQKKLGSTVMSGTVVQNGYLEVETTKNAQESTLKQLKQAVEDVQADRGEYAALVDRFANYWTPAIVTATVLLIVIGGGVTEDWKGYLHRGLVLLILACPCAIVVAAPIPSVCAIATAAKNGVLIKGSTVIEKLCTIDTVAVDKTGTLTKGYFQVRNKIILFHDDYIQQQAAQQQIVDNGHTHTHDHDHSHNHHKHHHKHHHVDDKPKTFYHDPYKLAVALEAKSTHPLANAIVSDYCGCIADMLADDLVLPTVKKVHVREGVGLEGYVQVKTRLGEGEDEKEWRHVVVGNERLLTSHGGNIQATPQQERQIARFIADNDSCVILLIVIDDLPHMLISLADEVRKEARSFVRELAMEKISVSMLTGDHESVAQSICQELQIQECQSRLLPDQKLQWIKDSQALQGKRVLMIGDGINDSTALACSTVGVAMGAGGTAMAVAAADVVLLNDNLSLLPTTISLCHLAKNTIIQNCTFAIAVKIVAMVLAVAGMLEFWEAVLIDIGSLLLVVLNGTKVLSFRKFRRTETSTKIESKRGVYGESGLSAKSAKSAKSPMIIQEV